MSAKEQAINLKFVEEVEKWPVLYNRMLPGYSQKDLVEKAWSEVGTKVEMTVAECKERWKNLKTVFVRHRKTENSCTGSKIKKPYYLSDAMQFTIPYIKALTKSSGDFSHVPKEEEEDELDETNTNEVTAIVHYLDEPSPTPQPSQSTPVVSSVQQGRSQQQKNVLQIHPTFELKRGLVQNDDVNNTFLEYSKIKKEKLTSSSDLNTNQTTNPKSEAMRMFLLSLMPDLEAMTDNQMRQFKQMCLKNIDELLNGQV